MKDVSEMTVEECAAEAHERNAISGSRQVQHTHMQYADAVIRSWGWDWEKRYVPAPPDGDYDVVDWSAFDCTDAKRIVTVSLSGSPCTDLWRLAVLVWRAKSSPKAGGEGR